MGQILIGYPKAKAVIAHAITDDEEAEARLTLRQTLTWFAPDSLEATPTTPARIANTRK